MLQTPRPPHSGETGVSFLSPVSPHHPSDHYPRVPMSTDNNEPRQSWQIMAQFAEHMPEVPVPILEAVARLCIEPDDDARMMFGFDFISALNDLQLITLMAANVPSSAHGFIDLPEFDCPPDYDKPRFSRYGFRLDRPPEDGDNETGTPVLADDVWVGNYTVHTDNGDEKAIRFVVSFDVDDPTHPDVIEWWLSADNALRLATNLTKHAS